MADGVVTKTELVNRLVEAGLDVSSAEKFVLEVVERYKRLNPMADDYKAFKFAETAVNLKVQHLKRLKGKIYEGIVIAIDDPRDMYDSLKRIALSVWKNDRNRAIMEGYAKPSDTNPDEPILLDWRKTLRSGVPNPNYGKPIPTRIVTDVYMIVYVDNEPQFKIVSFDGEPPNNLEIGKVYSFAANGSSDSKYMTPIPIKPFEEVGVIEPQELYDLTYQTLSTSGFLLNLSLLPNDDVRNYSIIATMGTVMDRRDISKGTILFIEDLQDPTGLGASILCRNRVDIDVGTEVIVIGQLRKGEDGIRIYEKGLIPNPNSDTPVKELIFSL